MKREPFVEARQARWTRLEALLKELESSRRRARPKGAWLQEFSGLYREVCSDLALTRHRRYGRGLEARLNDLALRGHHQLYRRSPKLGHRVWEFVAFRFPQAVRGHSRWFFWSTLLFTAPLVAMLLVAWLAPEGLRMVLDADAARAVEDMYDPAQDPMADGRASLDDLGMFAFYIYNNGSIALRTFAGALLFGVGTIFILVYNGLHIGAIFGHLSVEGMGETLYPFVIGHGSFELTAIVLSGAAGLKVGFAALAPGRRSRTRALAEAARECVPIVVGMFGMIVVAAFIEGFWSPSSVSPPVKYTVGTLLWLLVAAYFTFAGRAPRAGR